MPEIDIKSIRSIRTYEDDIASAVKNQNESLVSISLAEKRREAVRARTAQEQPLVTARHALAMYISIIFLVLGIACLVTVVYFYRVSMARQPITVAEGILTYNFLKTVDITDQHRFVIVDTLNSLRNTLAMSDGSVAYISLTKKFEEETVKIKTNELFSALSLDVPAPLTRSLSDNFMLGFYNAGNNEPFIIIKTTDFDIAYAEMLQWENNMYLDLHDIFKPYSQPVAPVTEFEIIDGNITPTSTVNAEPPSEATAFDKKFTDLTIRNKDTRALRDSNEDVVLIYSFLDKETILVTTTDKSFRGLVEKYISSRLVR